MPGPGNYAEKSTFGEKDKGPSIAIRLEEKIRQGPGPGQYEADASAIQASIGGSVKIGQAERKDLWTEKMQSEQPGPGNYTDETMNIGKAV